MNKTVYVLEYYPIDLAECNGVFSTYEKAKQCFEEDYARCQDIWQKMEIGEDDEKNCLSASWHININGRITPAEAYICETNIDGY